MVFFAAGTSVLGVGYFWVAFIVASVLGQVNVPFLSKFVRDTAKRGKTRGVNFEEDDDTSKHLTHSAFEVSSAVKSDVFPCA